MKQTTKEQGTALIRENEPAISKFEMSQLLVEAEKMFDRMEELTCETARRAYDFFEQRGGEFGSELEDWFKAEREILRPVPVEIKESNGNILVSAAVPGFEPKELEVSVQDKTLIISGETESHKKEEEENTIVQEWKSNKIFRQLSLPSSVEKNKAEAHLKNGILELSLPKAAGAESTKVLVQAG